MSGDVLSLAAEMTPYVSAAAASYGGAVLATVRDEAADATVGLGRRLLQRVFGVRREGEPLPEPVADLAASPRDKDALAAVRLAIRKAVAADPALEAELRSMLGSAPGVVMHVNAERDAISSGRDQMITIHNYADTVATLPKRRLPPQRAWGNVPPRNPGFKGREELLAAVREALLCGDRAAVQALHGRGGVGKTQLAVEYAHRFAGSYDLVWWISCEQPELIGEQFTALAEALGCAQPGAALAATRLSVMARLHELERWLLIFDNVEEPAAVYDWLPGGTGHVIITSRASGWAEIAMPVEVGVLARAESVAILRDRLPTLADGDVGRIADAVGDLALAVAQAAGYMADAGTQVGEYVALLEGRAAQMMRVGRPPTYPRSLAAVTQLALERLRAEDPAAAEVAVLCAFLAPEPILAQWFARAAAALPAPLTRKAADPVTLHQCLAAAGRSGLVRIGNGELQMHRLTQAIIRGQLSARQAASARSRAEAMLAASHPGTGTRPAQDPVTWPEWAQILRHVPALDPARSQSPQLRALASAAAWYLAKRGDAGAGHDLARHLHRHWRETLGPDEPDTLHAQHVLAFALSQMGRYEEAHDLDEDTLARRRRTLGDNHILTLNSANALASRLFRLENFRAARELLEDTLSRARVALGADHPDTIGFAMNLANYMSQLGEADAARPLYEDALAQRRQALGNDHPDTIICASNLANNMRELGEVDAARQLHDDALRRFRRILGEDHPESINCASNLAIDMRELGEFDAARKLHEDTLARYRQSLGNDHPYTLESIEELAADLLALGDLQTAHALDEEAFDGYRRIFGDDHPRTLQAARRIDRGKTAPDSANIE
jgi:tetratricopeptide (TPR) repeat protein